jgi:hypothetical protein
MHKGSGIFVRENGETKEISREEWDAKFPGREPVIAETAEIDDGIVYEANITNNLREMAIEAGIYDFLWRPEEIGVKTANDLIEPLTTGLKKLTDDPDKYKAFNPPNGWGSYEGFVGFVSHYLDACRAYPNATIGIWR